MKSSLTMLFLSDNIVKTSVFTLVILIAVVSVCAEDSGEKSLDIKIGFDLTQGNNGPSIRIRDFEDSQELRPRAAEEADPTQATVPSPRASSSSSSEDVGKDEPEGSPKRGNSGDSDNNNNNNDSDNDYSGALRYSTRGLNPDEYEPNNRAHVIKQKPQSSDSDSDKSNRRRKRSLIYEDKNIMSQMKFI